MNIHTWEDGAAERVDLKVTLQDVPAIIMTASSAPSGVSSAEANDFFAGDGGVAPLSHGGRASTMTKEHAAAIGYSKAYDQQLSDRPYSDQESIE